MCIEIIKMFFLLRTDLVRWKGRSLHTSLLGNNFHVKMLFLPSPPTTLKNPSLWEKPQNDPLMVSHGLSVRTWCLTLDWELGCSELYTPLSCPPSSQACCGRGRW